MTKSEYKEQLLCYISAQIDRLTVKQIRQLIASHAVPNQATNESRAVSVSQRSKKDSKKSGQARRKTVRRT